MPLSHSPNKVTTRSASIREATLEQSSSSEDENEPTMEQLRSQLRALRASAAIEKQERQRLEELLNQQQYMVSTVLTDIPTSVASSVETVPMSVTHTTTASRMNVTPTVPPVTLHDSVTNPIATANTLNNPSTATTAATSKNNCPYYWPRSSLPQTQSTSTVQHSFMPTPSIPTFLPSINSFPTFNQQRNQSEPTFPPTQPMQVSSSASLGNYRKLHNLPEFHGRPEEWPMFCTAFIESTNMQGYTKVENMFRLQRSIRGEAREAVESLLIHPNNVEQVMATLEFRFGRPECLIQSQLRKIREVKQISEDKLELMIPFATKVQNLSVFLETSGMYQHLANPTLIDELVNKLPMSKRLDWAQYSVNVQPFVTIKTFNEWLSRLARLVCVVTASSLPAHIQNKGDSKIKHANVLHAAKGPVASSTFDNKCRYCKGSQHPVNICNSFKDLNPQDKWEFLKRNKLCFGCLRYGHALRTCRLRKECGIDGCSKKHHQLLHEENSPSTSGTGTCDTQRPHENQEPVLSCSIKAVKKILFRILPVRVYNGGAAVKTFALLDEGSSITIMSRDLADRLQLNGIQKDLSVQWFSNETIRKKSFIVDAQISADEEDAERFSLNGVQTVEELRLPSQTFIASELDMKSRRLPAVPLIEYSDAKPEILIGLDNSHLGAPIGPVHTTANSPILAQTKLGWVIYGKSATKEISEQQDIIGLYHNQEQEQDMNLQQIVEEHFRIENFGTKPLKEKTISKVDKRALEILSTTTIKINNQYETGLLWKDNITTLPSSFTLAKRRLLSLENKMMKDADFAQKYKEIIRRYVRKGYARKLTDEETEVTTPKTWYLPHFGVKNPNKPGKFRLVFDAAADVNGISLNSVLLKGPDDYRSLTSILFNFRMRPVAVVGDIKEMFHQVSIRAEDQHSQRFLWRENPSARIDVYVMTAMTFGASCSPCSANFIKNLNASQYVKDKPRAVESVVNYHYVDDFVDSFQTIQEAIEVSRDVILIHRNGGFELRNFMSNSKEVLIGIGEIKKLPSENMKHMNIESTLGTEKVLGMCWDSVEDVFSFRLNFARVNPDVMAHNLCPSKRQFLGIVMSIYDPFGMIANYALHLKLLLRLIWSSGVKWDDPIPEESFNRWKQWKMELPNLTQLKIPRCHNYHLYSASRVDIHTFVDASEEAFSAVSYFRIKLDDNVCISFVCGKTKAAPKKLLSIPRLELSAAVLGVRLCNSIMESHSLPITERFFWSDSKTVLHWLRTDPRRHKEFVAFRIAEILESSQTHQWRWTPTKLNPADEGTRARYPPQFNVNNYWIRGPLFLKLDESEWPKLPNDIANHELREELRPKYMLLLNSKVDTIFDAGRFSTFVKLQRTMAWVERFIGLCRRRFANQGELSANELKSAESLICRQVQREAFSDEISKLQQNLPINRESKILNLTPYLDEAGLLRVKGRIDAAMTIPFVPRSQWIRGRVTKVFPASDGQVRSAEITTPSGTFRRPAVKLAVIEVGETLEPSPSPHGRWGVENKTLPNK